MLYGQDFENNVRLGPTPYIKETDRELNQSMQSLKNMKGLPWVKQKKQHKSRQGSREVNISNGDIQRLNSKSTVGMQSRAANDSIELLKKIIDKPGGAMSGSSSTSSIDTTQYKLFSDKDNQRIHLLGNIVRESSLPSSKHQHFLEKQRRMQVNTNV